MDVRPGYKQTEAGLIPADWSTHTIGESMRLINGRAFKPNEWRERGLPIIRIQNLDSGASDFNYFIGQVEDRHLVGAGDVLFAWSGTTGTSFGARVWDREIGVLNQHIFKVVPDKSKLTSQYAFLVLRKVQEQIEKQAHGFKASFVHIKKSDLVEVLLPLPTTRAEQDAIAEALSDADGLIESLEQLVAKKRRIKQGAMQELLTGKRRLPGFSGEWLLRPIGDVAPFQRGFDLPNSRLQPGPYPVVTSNGVLNHHIHFQVKGPGVVTGRSGTIGTVTFVDEDFWPHNTSLWVTSFRGNDPKFIYYLYTGLGLDRFATGSGVPTLNRNDVHAFKVGLPATRVEQAAIAATLGDMDTEHAALEAKLTKARQIKQGMMQNLLTGKIRLI